MTRKQKAMLRRIAAAAVLLVVLQLLPQGLFRGLDGLLFDGAGCLVRLALYLVDYLVIGHDILRKAWKGICNRQVFDENFLMAVATVGALALGAAQDGDYLEAIAVMLFYQIGEWFQSYAVGKSRRNISQLMDIRPDYANVERDGQLVQADPEEVAVGTVIVVRPGEKVPLDGVVVSGASTLNTAALTGESLPREVSAGEEVISGCINLSGLLHVRTTREFGQSTVSKILDLVENATSRKSKSEDFIAKFARVYTPLVCYSALALAIVPPLVGLFLPGVASWQVWLYRALTFLVASCPCALVISIPLTFFAGIGGASKAGVLVKGSNYLETLSQVRTVVFDKTGTLTQGVFEVSGIHHSPLEDAQLLEYAALAESGSSHPISKSIVRAYGRQPDGGCAGGERRRGHRRCGWPPGCGGQPAADGPAGGCPRPLFPRGHPHSHGPGRGIRRAHSHCRCAKARGGPGHGGPPASGGAGDSDAHRGCPAGGPAGGRGAGD